MVSGTCGLMARFLLRSALILGCRPRVRQRCRPKANGLALSQLHIDRILLDPHLVDRHIVRQWPAEELAGAHIVSGEVPRAYDDMAFEPPSGEGGPVMPARVADDVECPCHVDQQQPLLVGDYHLHLAWG